MSDFSAGVLVLNPFEEKLQETFTELGVDEDVGFVHPVNDRRLGLFLRDEWMADPSTSDLIAEVSKQVPLIHFMHPADHGWFVMAYVRGEVVCNIMRSYDAPEESGVECADWSVWRTLGLSESDVEQIRQSALGLREFAFMSYGYLIDDYIPGG